MQPTTSNLILQYLATHPMAPPRQIARSLTLSITDVRYHLQQMVRTGQVQSVTLESTGRPGRPALLYRLPLTCNPLALNLLVSTFLNLHRQSGSDPAFHSLAAALLPIELFSVSSPVVRITKTIQFLNTLGYEARWEARPQYPQVEFRRCPYAAIASQNPECCLLDQSILEVAIGFHVSLLRQSCIHPSDACLLQIHLDQPI